MFWGWLQPRKRRKRAARREVLVPYDTSGEVLWQMRLNNVVNSFPISFTVNGKQYVAVSTGDRTSSLVRSLNALTPEIMNPAGGAALWVFALPD
jgi:alcohol dehydrogenase (cytochrome c)